MTSMAASATSVALLPSKLVFRGRFEQSRSKFLTPSSASSIPCHSISISSPFHRRKPLGIQASVSTSDPQVRTGPDDLVASILSKVMFEDLLSLFGLATGYRVNYSGFGIEFGKILVENA